MCDCHCLAKWMDWYELPQIMQSMVDTNILYLLAKFVLQNLSLMINFVNAFVLTLL